VNTLYTFELHASVGMSLSVEFRKIQSHITTDGHGFEPWRDFRQEGLCSMEVESACGLLDVSSGLRIGKSDKYSKRQLGSGCGYIFGGRKAGNAL
jgi:hypothetical protein